MKKIIIPLFISITALTNTTTIANQVYPGKISTFENGDVDGWKKGPKSNSQPKIIVEQNGNHYLQIESFGEQLFEGERDPDSKMKFLNHTNWTPDFNTLGITAIKIRMANFGSNRLHMRLLFGNSNTNIMCMTETATELKTDNQWRDLVFSMTQPGLVCGESKAVGDIVPGDVSIENLKENINDLFFMSLKAPGTISKIIGTLGVDDIAAITTASLAFINGSNTQNQPAILDLQSDLVANQQLIQHIRDTPQLTNVNGVTMDYQIDASTGKLQIRSANTLSILRPVSAIMTEENEPGMRFNRDGYKQLFTHNKRRILNFPQPHNATELAQLLSAIGLHMEHDGTGNLRVMTIGSNSNNAIWFSVRADVSSTQIDPSIPSGLTARAYSNLPGPLEYLHQLNRDNALYQQSYHAFPADWTALETFLNSLDGSTNVYITETGVIHTTLGNIEYTARVDALVSPSDGSPVPAKTEFTDIGDINGDGLPDFRIRYRNGQTQTLYLLP